MSRTAEVTRTTAETDVQITLSLDGSGEAKIDTGVGFFDHLLSSLAHHALFDLQVTTRGDLEVDDHHTVEDTALSLGQALSEALGDRSGISRFGDAKVPMDEALAEAAVDLSGRSYTQIDLPFRGEKIGNLSTQNIAHSLEALARTAGFTLHLSGRGNNDHHLAEAAFKALARALRQASASDPRREGIASTKGRL
jgi:imidazoleglycerol-phosphate dehydratase